MINKIKEALFGPQPEQQESGHRPTFQPELEYVNPEQGRPYIKQTGLVPDQITQEAYFDLYLTGVTTGTELTEAQVIDILKRNNINTALGYAVMQVLNTPENQAVAFSVLKQRGLLPLPPDQT